MEATAFGFGGESGAEFAVGSYSTGDEDAADAKGFGGGEGLLHEVAYYGVLEAGDEVEDLLGTEGEGFLFGLGRAGWKRVVFELRFVVSHPFRKKMRKGWGTRRFFRTRRLPRMTGV